MVMDMSRTDTIPIINAEARVIRSAIKYSCARNAFSLLMCGNEVNIEIYIIAIIMIASRKAMINLDG
jgi:hypothetical protein